MAKQHTDIAIIGGGLHGWATAMFAAQLGAKVVVIEKDYPGRHASGVNAGGVRSLGRHYAEVPLSVASTLLWQNLENLVDDDCGYAQVGQLKIAENHDNLEQQQQRVAQLQAMGFEHEQCVDQQQLRELLPVVAPHCVGGIYVKEDGYALPFQTLTAFQRKAMACGAQSLEGTAVEDIQQQGNGWVVHAAQHQVVAGHIVNCAGAWGKNIATMLGEPRVPLIAAAPMLMITERLPICIPPVIGVQGRTLSLKQFSNGTVLIGGGYRGEANEHTGATSLHYPGLASNAQTAIDVLPIMRNARIVRNWAGIEGVTPDAIPVLGKGNADTVVHGFGYSAHGFQLGPICGKILAELVVQQHCSFDLSPFSINRFAA